MNITEYTIQNKTVTWMVVLLLTFGGIFSFTNLGRLEDPAFTIKQAMILVNYPGASALEVEEELTLPVENALQQLPYLDNISSTSSNGLSQIMVEMKSIYRKHHLAQIWDQMRRKINDMRGQLPPGVEEPLIIDEFGDVFGIFLAITGE